MVQEIHDRAPAIPDACADSIFGHAETLEADIEADIEAAMQAHGIASGWPAESLARHIQTVRQGAYILAKASGDPEMVRESIDHIIRYLGVLFSVATGTDGPKPAPQLVAAPTTPNLKRGMRN